MFIHLFPYHHMALIRPSSLNQGTSFLQISLLPHYTCQSPTPLEVPHCTQVSRLSSLTWPQADQPCSIPPLCHCKCPTRLHSLHSPIRQSAPSSTSSPTAPFPGAFPDPLGSPRSTAPHHTTPLSSLSYSSLIFLSQTLCTRPSK